MKSVRVFLLAVALAVGAGAAAHAAGAIAVGKGSNVVKSGIAAGLSTDFATTKAASADALAQCRSSKVKASTRSLCKVVKTFTKQCAAIAVDPRPGRTGFGWGVGATKFQASAAAVAACAATAGKGQQGFCKAVGGDCD
jgi:hypothetical protein